MDRRGRQGDLAMTEKSKSVAAHLAGPVPIFNSFYTIFINCFFVRA
jgi:hypothetical protein